MYLNVSLTIIIIATLMLSNNDKQKVNEPQIENIKSNETKKIIFKDLGKYFDEQNVFEKEEKKIHFCFDENKS